MPTRIRELPARERPRGRMAAAGPEALSDPELLAALIAPDTLEVCHALLARLGGWAGLAAAEPEELAAAPRVTPSAAAQIRAAVELHRRMLRLPAGGRARIHSPADAVGLLRAELDHRDQERLVTVILDGRNQVLRLHTVYVGALGSEVARAGEVFREAVRANAPAIILARNHTHGDPTPSPDDILLTRAVVQAGRLLDIDVLDSLVLAGGRYVSCRERGLGFGQ